VVAWRHPTTLNWGMIHSGEITLFLQTRFLEARWLCEGSGSRSGYTRGRGEVPPPRTREHLVCGCASAPVLASRFHQTPSNCIYGYTHFGRPLWAARGAQPLCQCAPRTPWGALGCGSYNPHTRKSLGTLPRPVFFCHLHGLPCSNEPQACTTLAVSPCTQSTPQTLCMLVCTLCTTFH
jgi:hypothetical protein